MGGRQYLGNGTLINRRMGLVCIAKLCNLRHISIISQRGLRRRIGSNILAQLFVSMSTQLCFLTRGIISIAIWSTLYAGELRSWLCRHDENLRHRTGVRFWSLGGISCQPLYYIHEKAHRNAIGDMQPDLASYQ